MADLILKNLERSNLNEEIVGFELIFVYQNVAIGKVSDIANLDFDKYEATILKGDLTNSFENLYLDNKNEVFGSEGEETRKLTQEEANNAISLFKAILLKRVEIKYATLFKEKRMNVPIHERQSWGVQKEEALAWQKDKAAAVPFLTELGKQRGVTVESLATKILEKTAKYEAAMAQLLGEQKNLTDRIKSTPGIDALRKLEEEI